MDRELCIVHANCQGEPLIARLNCCPEFRERYECRLYTNYIREPIPDQALAQCSLFLYQHLDAAWEELASEALLAKLPETARSLCIPNMFFKGYWPTWSGKAGFDYRCELLDSYIDTGLPPEEAVLVYIHTDMGARFDLTSMVADTLKQERERESHTPIKYVDLIKRTYRDIKLFNTINHPGPLLMDHAAKGVLAELGLPAPEEAALVALGDPFPEFEEPINPKVADFFGWDFAGPDTKYEIYGRKMTFTRWVSNYVFARQAGVKDFIAFLQGADIAL